jgi:hypothetical protein
LIEDTISLVVQRKNACLVLPTLPHVLNVWPEYCEAFKDAFGEVKVTRTAIVVPPVVGLLRLWVPYGDVAMKSGKPVQPMDWEPNRRGFTFVSPYYTRKELARLVA